MSQILQIAHHSDPAEDTVLWSANWSGRKFMLDKLGLWMDARVNVTRDALERFALEEYRRLDGEIKARAKVLGKLHAEETRRVFEATGREL